MKRRDLLRRAGGALTLGAGTVLAGCSSSDAPRGTYVGTDGNDTTPDGFDTTRTTTPSPYLWSVFALEDRRFVETESGAAAVEITVTNTTSEANAVTFVFYAHLTAPLTGDTTTAATGETSAGTTTAETVTSQVTTTGEARCRTEAGAVTIEAPYVVARRRVELDGGETATVDIPLPISWSTFEARRGVFCLSRKNLARRPPTTASEEG